MRIPGEKRKKTENVFTVLSKYILVLCILLYIIFLIHNISGSNKSFDAVKNQVMNAMNTEELKDAGTQGLKRYYGLNSADYEGVMLYVASTSMSAEEILLIKVKNEEQISEIQDAITDRLEKREKDFNGYAPEQEKLLENVQISIRGKFVFLAISKNAGVYQSVFSKSL